MANVSIYAAFERLWQHVIAKLGDKAELEHNHDDVYYTETEINALLSEKSDTGHAHIISDVTNLQTALDGKAASSHTHTVSQITDLTATATELNYMDGVTSNVQTQLDAKAASNHTHNYAGSSSSGGAATSANKLNTDNGSATNPVYFSNGVPVACTYSLNKTVPSNAVFTDTNTKVTQTSTSSGSNYPLLLAYSASPTSGTSSTTYYNTGITANPDTGIINAGGFDGDTVSARCITIGSTNGDGCLRFDSASDSKILGTFESGSSCEMMRIGGDATTPLLIIGEGLYTNSVGNTNISAGSKVQILTPNERIILEDIGSSSYSGYFRPNTNGTCALGTTANKWKQVFAATSSISTSDEREKNNITAIADYPSMFSSGNIFEILFSKLIPKTYYLNLENESPELHIGFIAQDIASVLEEMGMSEEDLGFLHHGFWTDEETGEEKDAYGLRYEEFIALNTYMIQKLMAEKEDIKSRLEKIEEALGISSNE